MPMSRGKTWGLVVAAAFAALVIYSWTDHPPSDPVCAEGDYDCRYTGFLRAIHAMPPQISDLGILVIPSKRAIDLTFAHLVVGSDSEAAFLADVLGEYPKSYKPFICSPEHVAMLNRRIAAAKLPWMRDGLVEEVRQIGCPSTLRR